MTESALHTLELSHGKPRLTAPRLSDVGTVPTEGERSADHAPAGATTQKPGTFVTNNKAARKRGAKRALRRPYAEARLRVRNAVSEARSAVADPSALPTADALMADTFTLHLAGMSELGTDSTFVQGQSLVYAAETILYGFYLEAAGHEGLLTDRGMLLKAKATECATLAARALTAALAAAKAVGKPRKGKGRRVIDAVEAEAGKP
ncbi:MAG TPA: hypothetical protein VJN18_14845 [Polyangiaceae bacterium]|nr:hypothetical protein [Polyangiaceae bacterium]